MAENGDLDATDAAILELLLEDGRRTVSDIAQRVGLSLSPVTRRIDRLERIGVVLGYTTLLDYDRLGAGLEAFTEVRYASTAHVRSITDAAMAIPEVVEVFTVAGDRDALIRLRVRNVQHLQQVVDGLRRKADVVSTKTHIVLSAWRRNGTTQAKHAPT